MADIQPKNTDTIRVNTIKGKSAGTLTIGPTTADAISLKTNDLPRFALEADGDLAQDATNGGNILVTKASTCVVPGPTSTALTATGTVIGDALDLVSVFNNFTTVAAGTGAQLWNIPTHGMIAVRNGGANALLVYPEDGVSTINGGAGGAAVSLATATLGLFWKTSSTAWIALEFAVAAA